VIRSLHKHVIRFKTGTNLELDQQLCVNLKTKILQNIHFIAKKSRTILVCVC